MLHNTYDEAEGHMYAVLKSFHQRTHNDIKDLIFYAQRYFEILGAVWSVYTSKGVKYKTTVFGHEDDDRLVQVVTDVMEMNGSMYCQDICLHVGHITGDSVARITSTVEQMFKDGLVTRWKDNTMYVYKLNKNS